MKGEQRWGQHSPSPTQGGACCLGHSQEVTETTHTQVASL